MTKKKMLFVYNARAGKAKIGENLHDIIDIFVRAGYEVTIYPTQGRGDAKELVKNRETDFYDLIVCSGGDGTLDEVVSGMMQCDEKIPIGYIPTGSTNDFAQSLGISNNMMTAAEDIVAGKTFLCDIGNFNENAFVYIAAFGLFTEVSYITEQQLKNTLGHVAYVLEGVKTLSSVKSYEMRIESEAGTYEGDYMYGMITNSTSVGGIRNITGENVQLDDGKFEVTLIKRPTNLNELRNIVYALVSKKMESQFIQCFSTSYLKIESEEAINWTLDGEFGGNHRHVFIKNEQKAILFVCSYPHEG